MISGGSKYRQGGTRGVATIAIRMASGPSRGGGGKFSRAPRRFGAQPSLKNTENGVPGGFFLT